MPFVEVVNPRTVSTEHPHRRVDRRDSLPQVLHSYHMQSMLAQLHLWESQGGPTEADVSVYPNHKTEKESLRYRLTLSIAARSSAVTLI